MGIQKTKQMLRLKVWWTSIDKMIEDKIQSCEYCAAANRGRKPHIERVTSIPEVWEKLNVDICGPLPEGYSLLAIVDQASRWPHVYIVKSTETTVIIEKLTNLFSTLGKPVQIISDNGPQFTAKSFKEFCSE